MYIKLIERYTCKREDNNDNNSKTFSHTSHSKSNNPLPSSITELMRSKDKVGEKDYCNKHKYHFNQKLSEYAVEELMFVDINTKIIPYDKCLELLKGNGIKLPKEATEGDLHYIANKIRAEHSLDTVKNDAHVIRLAVECLENPNKEEGDIFIEWLEHMYRMKKDIIWNKFIS